MNEVDSEFLLSRNRLAGFFEIGTDRGEEEVDQRDALRHFLSVDIFSLLSLLPREVSAELRLRAVALIPPLEAGGIAPRSMGELLSQAAPAPEWLSFAKSLAKAGIADGLFPPSVARVLYYATIAKAQLQGVPNFTSLPTSQTSEGFDWLLGLDWLTDPIRALVGAARQRLEPR